VASPRIAASTKSDLLFEILKQLRAAQITLSTPQMLVVQNMPAGGEVNKDGQSQTVAVETAVSRTTEMPIVR
jgi:small-conductance mechanosensitive channel